jgi:hypothetical protein
MAKWEQAPVVEQKNKWESAPVIESQLTGSKSRNELEFERSQRKSIMQKEMADLPENAGGVMGNIAGGYLTKSPYGMVAGGTIGQGLGKFIDLANKKIVSGQKSVESPESVMSWSDIFYESKEAAKRGLMAEGISLGISPVIGLGMRPLKAIGRKLLPKALPAIKESQELLAKTAKEEVLAGRMTEKQAGKATLTVGQSAESPILDFVEGVAENALGGGSIRTLKKDIQVPLYEKVAQNTLTKDLGVKRYMSVSQLGKYLNFAKKAEDKAFSETSKEAFGGVINLAKQEIGDRPVNVKGIIDNINKPILDNPFFNELGNTSEGRAVSAKVQRLFNDTLKQKKGKMTYTDVMDLYHKVNTESASFYTGSQASKAEKKAIGKAFIKIQDSISEVLKDSSMDRPQVYDQFTKANQWFAKEAPKHSSDMARQIANEFDEHPEKAMSIVMDKKAIEKFQTLKGVVGEKNYDKVKTKIKNTFLGELFNNPVDAKGARVFDPQQNRWITDPKIIHKRIYGLDKEVRRQIMTESEENALEKALRLGMIIDAPSDVGKVGRFVIGSAQLGAAASTIGFGGGVGGVTGVMILSTPYGIAKIMTNPKYVDKIAGLSRLPLKDIPKKDGMMKTLFKELSSDEAISGEVRLFNSAIRNQENDFIKDNER